MRGVAFLSASHRTGRGSQTQGLRGMSLSMHILPVPEQCKPMHLHPGGHSTAVEFPSAESLMATVASFLLILIELLVAPAEAEAPMRGCKFQIRCGKEDAHPFQQSESGLTHVWVSRATVGAGSS